MARVEPVYVSGEEMMVVRIPPVPLPERRPLSVVLPVPPMLTARVEEAERLPEESETVTPAPSAVWIAPVLEMLKSVVVAVAVEEPTAKRAVAVSPLFV